MAKRIIKLIISICFGAIDYAGKLIYSLFAEPDCPRCVVLYYHSVKITERYRFIRQLDEIMQWTNPISIDTKVLLKNGLLYTVVTFDDGFESLIHWALPELIKRKIPVIIFIPTGSIGKEPSWLKQIYHPDSDEVVMTHNQIKELRNIYPEIISFGSHCVTHTALTSLNDEEARHEIFDSKCLLESILKEEITTLSFPHGEFSRRHLSLALQAGYRYIFSIQPKICYKCINTPVIGRVRVDPADWPLEFLLNLHGAYRWLPAISKLKYNFINSRPS